jgi:RNA polymerase sigma-70 factor, ECF subfamily
MLEIAWWGRRERARSEASEIEAWVVAARRGEDDAILSLLRRYRPPLVRVLTGVTGDEAAAEDAAQEAFLKAFRSLDQLKEPKAFYSWLRRLAVRQVLRRRPSEEPLEDALEQLDPRRGPAETIETRLFVQGVLARLPVELRTTLVLREIEQMDYREIAEAMEVPVGTVRSRLNSARERFRKVWREEDA